MTGLADLTALEKTFCERHFKGNGKIQLSFFISVVVILLIKKIILKYVS